MKRKNNNNKLIRGKRSTQLLEGGCNAATRLAWQVLVLLGSWEPRRAQLFCPVILCGFDAGNGAGQSAGSSLQYPSHKHNFIFLYKITVLFVHVYLLDV